MSQGLIFGIIGAIWLIGAAIFLKDYLLGERQVKRKRGTPTLRPPEGGYGNHQAEVGD